MLGTARLGYVNIHFSLLPRWRGAAPVERAIMAGDPMTGVTIILLDEGLDTGPVLNAQAVDIADFVTGGELTSVLAGLGARLVVKTLPDYVSGQVTAIRQVSDGATYARKLAPSDRPVRIDEDRVMTINRIRALAPRPGATLEIDGETFKILEASRVDLAVEPGRWESIAGVPVFGCSDGALEIQHLQPPGRRVVTGASWLRGLRRTAGVVA
jgi:methionyl-tRNA formyltransferase